MDSVDWGLEAVVRSCGGSAAWARRGVVARAPSSLEFIGQRMKAASFSSSYGVLQHLDHERQPPAPFSIASLPTSSERVPERGVFISFLAASTPGYTLPARRKHAGRKPGVPTLRKRSKKVVVREVPVANGSVNSSTEDDQWAWRKYGQKPIRGSPYTRAYYKCSSLKACTARKLVDRSPAKPEALIVTYIADHCHAVPVMINTLAGMAHHPPKAPRGRPSTSDKAAVARREEEKAEVSSSMAAELAGNEPKLSVLVGVEMELENFFGSFGNTVFFEVGDHALGERDFLYSM